MRIALRFAVPCRCGRHIFRPATNPHAFEGEGWYHATWMNTSRVDDVTRCMVLPHELDSWPDKQAEAIELRTRIVELRNQLSDLLST